MSDRSKNYYNKLAEVMDDMFGRTNGPEYRGAPYPPFYPSYINEKNIPDNMRAKYYSLESKEEYDDKYIFNYDYITQEEFDREDLRQFKKEFVRALNYNINKLREKYLIDKDVVAIIEVTCRDGSDYGHAKFSVKVKGEEEPDSFVESIDEPVKTFYYGFLGGDAGDYFEGDYFEIYRESDGKYHWREEVNTSDGGFNSIEEAKKDAIETLDPNDGSEFVVSEDAQELYKKIITDRVRYWLEYGNDPRDIMTTKKMTLAEIIDIYQDYVDNYNFAKVRSTDDDVSAEYNF